MAKIPGYYRVRVYQIAIYSTKKIFTYKPKDGKNTENNAKEIPFPKLDLIDFSTNY